jgi:hypothetical protein
LIPSSHLRLGLPSGLFPSGFPTKTPYTFLPYKVCYGSKLHLVVSGLYTTQQHNCYFADSTGDTALKLGLGYLLLSPPSPVHSASFSRLTWHYITSTVDTKPLNNLLIDKLTWL